MKSKMELKKIRDRENSKKYYHLHKEEIKARRKAKQVVKSVITENSKMWNPKMWISLPKPTEEKDIKNVYICDFYSKQLARIEKVLWWIAFAISFVGVAVLFK